MVHTLAGVACAAGVWFIQTALVPKCPDISAPWQFVTKTFRD